MSEEKKLNQEPLVARAMIRKSIIVSGYIALGVAILFVMLIVFMVVAASSANEEARQFCANVVLGEDIAPVVESLTKTGRGRLVLRDDAHLFIFQGGIFHAGVCRVHTNGGKVISTEVEESGD